MHRFKKMSLDKQIFFKKECSIKKDFYKLVKARFCWEKNSSGRVDIKFLAVAFR